MARILIIDDDDLLRDVLARALELAGHSVREAENGQAGLALFRGSPADLVITDLVMPVQEGVETIMQLRRLSPQVPILAISGGVPNSRLYLAIAGKIGAHQVLAKPFTPEQLLTAVKALLEHPGSTEPAGPS